MSECSYRVWSFIKKNPILHDRFNIDHAGLLAQSIGKKITHLNDAQYLQSSTRTVQKSGDIITIV